MRRRAGGKALMSGLCPHNGCSQSASMSPLNLLEICCREFLWERNVPKVDSIFIPSNIMLPEMFYHFCSVLSCQCFHRL